MCEGVLKGVFQLFAGTFCYCGWWNRIVLPEDTEVSAKIVAPSSWFS